MHRLAPQTLGLLAAAATLVLFFLLNLRPASAHSYLCEPQSRSLQCPMDRGQRGIGPCDATYKESRAGVVKVKRGDVIPVRWPRNNHPGGYIQLAWAPVERSDDQNAFNENIVKTLCHENPCNETNQVTTQCEETPTETPTTIPTPTDPKKPYGEQATNAWCAGGYVTNSTSVHDSEVVTTTSFYTSSYGNSYPQYGDSGHHQQQYQQYQQLQEDYYQQQQRRQQQYQQQNYNQQGSSGHYGYGYGAYSKMPQQQQQQQQRQRQRQQQPRSNYAANYNQLERLGRCTQM